MLFVYIISYFLSVHLSNANVDDLTLDLVQVIFRHGARTPSDSEAIRINVTDPAIYWPEGYYQLTNVSEILVICLTTDEEGKQQAYSLGILLRKKYDQFLGPYNPRQYHAVSSGFSRTIASLQLALASLFPPAPDNSWSDKLRWTPVPLYQNSPDIDITLAPHHVEKYLEVHSKTLAESSEYQKNLSYYKEFLEFMENKTGFAFSQNLLYNSGWTYYGVKYHKYMDLPLPNWYADDAIFTNLTELFKLSLESMSCTPQLKRLNGGTLVRQLIENIKENRNAAKPKKIYLYSTHDLTLYGFSKAQDFEAFYIPPFGSALIVEKYTDSQKKEYLRILAWDPAEGENITTVKIGICEEFCPFEEYLEIVKNYTATDEDLEFFKTSRIPETY